MVMLSNSSANNYTHSPVSTAMSSIETADDRAETKELRQEHPSGWFYLTQHEAVPILIDALLDLPPNREFNKSEFAEHAGVTRQTVGNYTELLTEVELIEAVPNMSPKRYRVADSDAVRELYEFNSALNTTGDE